MATKVDDAIAELEEALDFIEPKYEGLQDFNRVNIHDDTRTQVTGAISEYGQRIDLLRDALSALQALNIDGYPTVQTFDVSQSVLLDLTDQQSTITAALAQFKSNEASQLKVTVGTPVPKASK